MNRHPVDIVSGALGALAVTLGVLIITGSIRDYDHRGGWWLTMSAIAIAIAIVPWRGTRTPARAEEPLTHRPQSDDPQPVTESTIPET